MFLRRTNRKKDGKEHRYFSIVENRRLLGNKTAQRTVLYLGEINDRQQGAWRKTLEVFDEREQRSRIVVENARSIPPIHGEDAELLEFSSAEEPVHDMGAFPLARRASFEVAHFLVFAPEERWDVATG